ncbi:MAG: hypothetical protein MHPSP_004004, partial [Paramarteilia canceri]
IKFNHVKEKLSKCHSFIQYVEMSVKKSENIYVPFAKILQHHFNQKNVEIVATDINKPQNHHVDQEKVQQIQDMGASATFNDDSDFEAELCA